jgi:phospholipid N-methyltransferase
LELADSASFTGFFPALNISRPPDRDRSNTLSADKLGSLLLDYRALRTIPENVAWWTFLRGFLRAPRSVGAIVPSSPWLVEALVEAARVEHAATVVEFGPGTGAVTGEILRRLPARARFVALELDPHFAASLRTRITDSRATIVTGCAVTAPQHLAKLGLHSVDCIVSSLPLTSLPRPVTQDVLRATTSLLRPGGIFVTYQYSAVVRPLLETHFRRTKVERLVIRNLPPALVFVCHKDIETPHRRQPSLQLVSE